MSDFEWAWMKERGEYSHGPFKTKEEAIADAQDYGDSETILLGHVDWPDPGDYVRADLDEIVERADESAYDSGCWCGDDELFVLCRSKEEAQKELNELLAAWARKWLSPTKWTFKEVEKVTLD